MFSLCFSKVTIGYNGPYLGGAHAVQRQQQLAERVHLGFGRIVF
jgi:hypothetical protein